MTVIVPEIIPPELKKYNTPIPRVGVALIVKNRDRCLLGKRLSEHCHGLWGFPGGHLEYGEEFEYCALRELREECGHDIKISNPEFYTANNNFLPQEERHSITIFMQAIYRSGNAITAEPEKCAGWQWHRWDDLPRPIMPGIYRLLNDGYNPFDW